MTELDQTYAALARTAIAEDSAVLTSLDRHADFESRLRFGLSEVLQERPELRETMPLAAMMDDAVRWCA